MSLIEASWQNDRVVLIDAGHLLTGLNDFPRLGEAGNMETLCHHASVLKANHLVATGIDGTELPILLSTIGSLPGGCIITTRSNSADGAFENLGGGLALALSSQTQAARSSTAYARCHCTDQRRRHRNHESERRLSMSMDVMLFSSRCDGDSADAAAGMVRAGGS